MPRGLRGLASAPDYAAMNHQAELFNLSLENLCRHQQQPFFVLAAGNDKPNRVMRNLHQLVPVAFRSSAMFCGRLKDVVVFGRSYVTDAPGQAVFRGQSAANYDSDEWRRYYENEVRQEPGAWPRIQEECCYIGGSMAEVANFGHFVFEYLSRLVAFDMVGALRCPVVVHDSIPLPWLSFIELYGVKRIIRVPRLPASRYDSVWVAACPHYNDGAGKGYALWDDGVLAMHHVLRQNAVVGTDGPKRIFMGRGRAAHRRLLNEDEVWRDLESAGFVYPDFTGLSAAEQVRLVGSAEIIVTVGGAGSVITQWAPKNCIIIEILQKRFAGVFGSRGFAVVLGQSFCRVPAADVGEVGMNTDMLVDVEAVKSVVGVALQLSAQ